MKTLCVVVLLGTASVVNFGSLLLGRISSDPQTASSAESAIESVEIDDSQAIHGIGYVEPVSGVRRLAFSTGGKIVKWHVQVGQRVEAGTALVELDSSEIKAEIKLAQQRLKQVRAERAKLLSGANPHQIKAAEHAVEISRERLRLSKSVFDRHQQLPTSAISRTDFERSQAEFFRSRAEFKRATSHLAMLESQVRPEDRLLADAQVAVAEAEVARCEERRKDRIIFAPHDGVVLEQVRRVGESVSSVEPSTVAVFADSDSLQIRVEVDERFVEGLHEGMSAVAHGRAMGTSEFTGRVMSIRQIMGKKTVFARSAEERKELDVIQLIVATDEPLEAPIGLRLDVVLKRSAND